MSTTTANVSPTITDGVYASSSVDPSKTPAIAPVSKHILDGIFGVMALMLIMGLCLWRIAYLNRHEIPLRDFFCLRKPPSSQHQARRPSHVDTSIRVPPPALLTSISPFSPPRRARRGADIDGHGRRGSLGDKDELPAYEGPPPKYRTVDLEMGLGAHVRMQVSSQLQAQVPDAPPYTVMEERVVDPGVQLSIQRPL